MPQTEEEVKDRDVSNSPAKIISLWQKFHFSGRVIMCSVLFGLGLVLIGGLILAINGDDDTIKNDKDSDISAELPTKAPSNYVGPVVMGIGGFIVVVGVIMCMFETQVCRKKTADTKPLISDKNADVEANGSESIAGPSSSHCNKNHKHKSRKVTSSPRKTKSKHGKSHEQKPVSSKSPPISIDKSKNFITSSEENFLTPPNTLDEHAALGQKNSREAEIQTSSSLMKSFTSSGTWNQSTEFLTPTASLTDNSISVDNSVELEEKQGQASFKTNEVPALKYTSSEYMTPLTVDEEKVQEMFNQVKHEQKKFEKDLYKENSENLISEHGNVRSVIHAENEVRNVSQNDLSSDVSAAKESLDNPSQTFQDVSKNCEIVNEENSFSDNFSSKLSTEEFMPNNSVTECEMPDSKISTVTDDKDETEKDILPYDSTRDEQDSFVQGYSAISHVNETKVAQKLDSEPFDENISKNNLQKDLENSGSSEETLVSLHNSTEKSKNNDAKTVFSMTEYNLSDKSKASYVSESPMEDRLSLNNGISDQENSMTDINKTENVGVSDLTEKESIMKETKNLDGKSEENSS